MPPFFTIPNLYKKHPNTIDPMTFQFIGGHIEQVRKGDVQKGRHSDNIKATIQSKQEKEKYNDKNLIS